MIVQLRSLWNRLPSTQSIAVIVLAACMVGGQAVVPWQTPGQEPGYGDDYDDYDDGDMEDMDDDGDEGYGGGYGDDYDDSDEDGGYGGGFGGGPSGAAAPLGPPSDAVQTYGSSLVALMGDLNLSPLWTPAPDTTIQTGPILKREAEEAFASGNIGLAHDLAFAHMAAEFPDSVPALKSVKYNALLRRPVWSTRWGVSIFIRGDGTSDPSPIRQGATPLGTPGRGGRGGGGGGGGFEMEMEMDMGGMEDEMAMDMAGMEDEMEEEMGDMEMEMMMEMEMGGGRPTPRGAAAEAAPARPVRKMLDPSIDETFDENLGLVAEYVAEKFKERYERGDFGALLTEVTMTQGPPTMSDELDAALGDADSLPMWKPGLPFVGSGPSSEMVAQARKAGIDLLLHFDVNLKAGRNDQVQNLSRCRLINVAAKDSKGRYGRTVGTSKALSSSEASQFASAGRMDEEGYVEEKLSNLFEIIDKQAKVVALPQLTPAIARNRVASLIGSSGSNNLRSLAEIRLYHAQSLIDEAEAEAAFDIIGGAEGLAMLYGPLDARLQIARKWAVAAQEK